MIRRLLCALGFHHYIYPAWSDSLRFCYYCNEWDHHVEKVGGGMTWKHMESIEDFQDYAKRVR